MTATGPRIGLVLGGGGIAGYTFHSAVLAALQDVIGFDPRTAEVIVGTSAGAIASALLRGDVPAAELRDRLLAGVDDPSHMADLQMLGGWSPRSVPRLWAGPGAPRMIARELRRGRNLRMSKVVAGLLPQGRSDLSPIIEPLEILHGQRWPHRQLWIPATELRSGRLAVFGRDHAATVPAAVEASAALPLFFAPVEIDGRSYIDGGIGSPFNANLLVDARLDLVVILAPLSIEELAGETPMSSVVRSLPRRRLRREVRQLEDAGTVTLVLQPKRAVVRAMGLNPMDPSRIEAVLERSDELVRRQIGSVPPAAVDLLEQAATSLESPPDTAYPAP